MTKKLVLWLFNLILIYTILVYYTNDGTKEYHTQLVLSIILMIIFVSFNLGVFEKILGTHESLYNIPTTKEDKSIANWDIKIKGQDFSFLRGSAYLYTKGQEKDVLISTWNISHFLIYLLCGILCPKLAIIWVFIGIWWEFLETFKEADCYDYSDIIYNISGLFLGIYIRRKYDQINKI